MFSLRCIRPLCCFLLIMSFCPIVCVYCLLMPTSVFAIYCFCMVMGFYALIFVLPPCILYYLLSSYCVPTGMLVISHGVMAFCKSVTQYRSSADACGTGEPLFCQQCKLGLFFEPHDMDVVTKHAAHYSFRSWSLGFQHTGASRSFGVYRMCRLCARCMGTRGGTHWFSVARFHGTMPVLGSTDCSLLYHTTLRH